MRAPVALVAGVAGVAGAAALSLAFSTPAWAFTPADAFAASRFDETSAQVTNRYLPMAPGTQYVYKGTVVENGETTRHRVVYTVTGLTKVVDGVRNRVILDQDFADDELAEEEIAMFAQDTEGVVWNMGEYPEEFENGKFVGAPSTWAAGAAGAKAGIHMQAAPATGTPEYSQGFAPAIDFDDRGVVSKTGQKISDKLGTYSDGVVVVERSATEPDDGHQLKLHAPGIGVVRIEAVGGAAQETLQRAATRTLDAAALAAVNAKALKLDRRAYKNASAVWADTAPAEGPGGTPTSAATTGEGLATTAGRSALPRAGG